MNILIGTTATNRLAIHQKVIPKWNLIFKKLLENNICDKIVWFINVDYQELFDEDYNYCEMKKFFIDNIDDSIEVIIMEENKQPSLFTACKNIFIYMRDYKTNNNLFDPIICWLEDDWDVNVDMFSEIFTKDFLKFQSKYWYINLTERIPNYFGMLAPAFMSYDLWCNYYVPPIMEKNILMCPEKCIRMYFVSKKIENSENIMTINCLSNNEYSKNVLEYSRKNENAFLKCDDKEISDDIANYGFTIIRDFKCDDDKFMFIRITPPLAWDIGINHRKSNKIKKVYFGRHNNRNFRYVPE